MISKRTHASRKRVSKIWRTVEILGVTRETPYLESFKRAGLIVRGEAEYAVPVTPLVSSPKKIRLVRFRLQDIGYTDLVEEATILKDFKKEGLRRCPPELALALFESLRAEDRLSIVISMDPVIAELQNKKRGLWECTFTIRYNQYTKVHSLGCWRSKGGGVLYRDYETIVFQHVEK